jgi:hypothetical protein
VQKERVFNKREGNMQLVFSAKQFAREAVVTMQGQRESYYEFF